eukprot:567524-Pleurochrysis_carterae.AAC.1
MLPAEGAIPASMTAARQQLLSAVRARIEEVVGEERLQGAARTEVRELAEAVLTADLAMGPV